MEKYAVTKTDDMPAGGIEDRVPPAVDIADDSMSDNDNMAIFADGTDISRRRVYLPSFAHFTQDDSAREEGEISSKKSREKRLPFHLYKHFSFPQHVHASSEEVLDRPKLQSQFSQPVDINLDHSNSIQVVPNITIYRVNCESQTQTDISWNITPCEESISKIYYQVQIRDDMETEWQNLSERRVPVIRLYSTEDVVVLDKKRWRFKDGAVTWLLRVRALIKDSIHNANNPWSEIITVEINTLSRAPPKFVSDKKGSMLY